MADFYDPDAPLDGTGSPFIFKRALGKPGPQPQMVLPEIKPPPTQAPSPTGYQPRGAYPEPHAADLARLQAQLEAPDQPMYSPEEQQRRQDQNQRDYQLGLLGILSGDQNLQQAGGMIFKQALANRQQKVTDKGVFDPVTGRYSLNAEAKKENVRAQYERLANLDAQGRLHWAEMDERSRQEFMRDRAAAADRLSQAQLVAGIAAGNRADARADRDRNTQFTQERQLRQEYEKNTEKYRTQWDATSNINNIVAGAQGRKMTVSEQDAIIYMLNKFLDPNSVVREGEYARTLNQMGYIPQAELFVQRIKQGALLDPAMAKSINDMATFFRDAAGRRISQHAKNNLQASKAYGLEPTRTVDDPSWFTYGAATPQPGVNVGALVGAPASQPAPQPASALPKAAGRVKPPSVAAGDNVVQLPY